MENENYESLSPESQEVQVIQVDAIERANIDTQVATAQKYPRDERKSIDKSVVMATMTQEVAESCGYALSRGGKLITGPSVNLAKIIAHNWKNLRIEAKVVRMTSTEVVSRGTCWDLETNVAASFEVIRSIVDNKGRRYSNDMCVVTGNASNSIAFRNAVFAVVPKPIIDRVYQAAQGMITGDLSDADKLLKKRTSIINSFKNDYAITESEVIQMCGKQTSNQINTSEIVVLIGILQSLKDGDTTVKELMKPYRVIEGITEIKKEMKQKKVTKKKAPAKLP